MNLLTILQTLDFAVAIAGFARIDIFFNFVVEVEDASAYVDDA